MKIEFRIYKTFDPELYALSAHGVKITKLVTTALYAYVRGEYVHFHTPRSIAYNFEGKRRFIHLAIDIKDEESIKFLKESIKPRQRTAFLKALVRGSLTTPQLGMFFRDSQTIRNETQMIKMADVEDLPNIEFLELAQEPQKDYLMEEEVDYVSIYPKRIKSRVSATSKPTSTSAKILKKPKSTEEKLIKNKETQTESIIKESVVKDPLLKKEELKQLEAEFGVPMIPEDKQTVKTVKLEDEEPLDHSEDEGLDNTSEYDSDLFNGFASLIE